MDALNAGYVDSETGLAFIGWKFGVSRPLATAYRFGDDLPRRLLLLGPTHNRTNLRRQLCDAAHVVTVSITRACSNRPEGGVERPYRPLATAAERVRLIARTGLAARQETETESLDRPCRAPFADPRRLRRSVCRRRATLSERSGAFADRWYVRR